ncbi:T3SS (YopN, CesT) and YbjN peptide-binding chaperone 1 [Mycolicibacterium septicum]|uniref:T3SS (YopN, CesT) and YbjN peptide-binding chaperone 1 n=1 Tax=Mycolicibacterium septicum TaxID=98668 RepID=UPI001F3DD686|nr:YbjN domain-containing protein [Mycolicibacterium septicum]
MYRAGRNNEPSFLQRMADTIGLGGGGEAAPEDDLDDWLARTLKDELGFKIERDDDGDLAIPYGSAVIFIGRHDSESSFLNIFAPLLADFTLTSDVYEAVNSINSQVPMAKAVVVDDDKQIVLSAQLPVVGTLSADELMLVIEVVAEAADHFDSLLQKRFGGTTMLDDDGDEFDV